MTSDSALNNLKKELEAVKASGRREVDVQSLIDFINASGADETAESDAKKLKSDIELADRKARHESQLAYFKAERDNDAEMFRSVIETAKVALTTSILVNGGAAAALLAFIGNATSKGSSLSGEAIGFLAQSLVVLALGVLCGATATGTTYLSQFLYSKRLMTVGAILQTITVSLVFGGYSAFAFGIFFARKAFGFQ